MEHRDLVPDPGGGVCMTPTRREVCAYTDLLSGVFDWLMSWDIYVQAGALLCLVSLSQERFLGSRNRKEAAP